MATELGRMVTYLDCHLPIKSNDHIITYITTDTMLMATREGRIMTYIE